jgi:hypothetical protein
MIWALCDVADAGVAEHIGDVILGVNLEDQLHRHLTDRTRWILGDLHPAGPSSELVLLSGHRDVFYFELVDTDGRCDVDGRAVQSDGSQLGVVLRIKSAAGVIVRARHVIEGIPSDDRNRGHSKAGRSGVRQGVRWQDAYQTCFV